MGRKKKIANPELTTEAVETNMVKDQLGEMVNLEKCPDCSEHPDCFSCIKGKCTALKESGGQSCVFYKTKDKALAEAKNCYQRLKDLGRDDLIEKYASTLSALGVFDEEISSADMVAGEMESFRENDLRIQTEKVDEEMLTKTGDDCD